LNLGYVPLEDIRVILNNQKSTPVYSDDDEQPPYRTKRWLLDDAQTHYGVLEGKERHNRPLSEEQQQLMNTVADTFAIALALENQNLQKEQWMLMEERATIARELHDSLAQSLSYLKMRLAFLQMQKDKIPEDLARVLHEMRKEVDAAYRQLRELLTTFRLQLDRAGLLAALENTIDEFNEKLGFPIRLDYHVEQNLRSEQTIHILQITREALSNIYKHADATEASVEVTENGNNITLRICDNGKGLNLDKNKKNHYGLIIMRDRAQSLNGAFHIENRKQGGVEVCVSFLLSDEKNIHNHE